MKHFASLLTIAFLIAAPAFAETSPQPTPGPAATQAAKAAAVKEGALKGSAQIAKPIVDDAVVKKGDSAKKGDAAPKAVKTAKATTPKKDPAAKMAKMGAVSFTKLNYVGEIETYKAKGDDTLLSIGEREGLGYVELRSANPAMDPWRPGNGTFMILPKMHLLPDAPRKGIVVNLSEMRVYYYRNDGQIKTYPIGVGREGFSTPMGTTTVVRKADGPTWRPTDRMRREDPTLKPVYTSGPDNPLGTHALYLGWPQYMLHGTNKPWGIGRRVSSGCVRMYNDAAEELYNTVPMGTPVAVVRQPIKFAWIGNMLYIEAHPDGALADQVERVGGNVDYKVPGDLFAELSKAAGDARDNINWQAVREALRDRRGYPVPILQGAKDDDLFVSASMIERAGTSRFGPGLTQSPMEDEMNPGVGAVPASAAQGQPPRTPEPAPDGDAPPERVRRSSGGFNG